MKNNDRTEKNRFVLTAKWILSQNGKIKEKMPIPGHIMTAGIIIN